MINKKENRAAWFRFTEESPCQQFYQFSRKYIDEAVTQKVPDKNGEYKNKCIEFNLFPKKGFMEQIPVSLKNKYEEDKGRATYPETQKERKYEEKKYPEINDFIKNAYKNEQKIRRICRSDVFLFEMIKYTLNKITDTSEFLSLDKVWLTQKERAEQSKEARKQSVKEKGDTSENRIKEDYLLSFPINLKLFGGAIEEQVKIKDIGRFRKLEKDQRIKTLVDYYASGLWKKKQPRLTIEELEKERESYHKIRIEEIFKEVHKLEKEIYDNTSEEDKKNLKTRKKDSNKEYPSFKHYISSYFLPEKDREDFNKITFNEYESLEDIPNRKSEYDRYYLLVFIRNKFAHNQLLAKYLYEASLTFLPNNGDTPDNDDTLAMYYLRLFGFLVKEAKENKRNKQNVYF